MKEDVAVSALGLRIALVCSVLSAVAYECLNMLIVALRFYYHNKLGKKTLNDKDFCKIEMAQDNPEDITDIVKDNKVLKTQVSELTEKIKDLNKLLENERKKHQYSNSNTYIEDKMPYNI